MATIAGTNLKRDSGIFKPGFLSEILVRLTVNHLVCVSGFNKKGFYSLTKSSFGKEMFNNVFRHK